MKIKLIGSKLPQIQMTKIAQHKIELIVEMSSEEVGWIGLVELRGNIYEILDVYVLKQEVNGGTTEIDKGAWGDLWAELVSQGVLTNDTQNTKGLYLWGHSHVNMATGASSQDIKQFNDMIAEKPPFMIRMITNKKNDYGINLYCGTRNLEFEELEIFVEDDKPAELRESIKSQLASLVKPLTYSKIISTVGGTYREDPFAVGGAARADTRMNGSKDYRSDQTLFDDRSRFDLGKSRFKHKRLVEGLRKDAGDIMRRRRSADTKTSHT